jgi:hypothetical protein
MKKTILILILVSSAMFAKSQKRDTVKLMQDVSYTKLTNSIQITSSNDAITLILKEKFKTVAGKDTIRYSTSRFLNKNHIYIPLNMEDSLKHIFNKP